MNYVNMLHDNIVLFLDNTILHGVNMLVTDYTITHMPVMFR